MTPTEFSYTLERANPRPRILFNVEDMLTIRFNRTGRKNRAYFRVVVQEHTVAPGGRHTEVLGSYDPHQKKAVLKSERIQYWIGQGAQPSDSAWNLFVREGVVEGKKRAVKMERPKPAEPVVTEEAPKEDAAPAAEETAPTEEAASEEPAA